MAPKKSSTGGKDKGGSGDAEADRVHVVVRIRPPVRKDEKFGEGSEALQYDAEKNMLFLLAKDDEGKAVPKQFAFDKVLWKDSTQTDAWEAAGLPVVKAIMQGYTGCVMCYGQTGAGKTFTLANEKAGSEGVMIQAFKHVFEALQSERELKYEVCIAYQQIYLDGISDLLQPNAPVELREDPKEGVYVSGAKWANCTTTQDAIATLQKGNANRTTAATKMNADSSRSHAVLMLKVKVTGGVRTLNGMLYLVDLAGSERVKKSGVEGAAFDEAKAINQSLTTLGRCIEVLASNKKEKPPFRESKLTRLLSNAIGGGAKTTLVVCVAPTMTDQFETTNTLDFGQQAMNVVVRAKVNASTDYGSLTASLLQQRDKKQKPIRELEAKVLRSLGRKLDEVYDLELECKRKAIEVEIQEERVDVQKDRAAAAKAAGESEAEADKLKTVELLNEKARSTDELERVLLQLSTDPEMKRIQSEHEQEKAQVTQRSMVLQEELRAAEHQERQERKKIDDKLEGVVHTARNLGQIAAYFLQTGAMEEAADFYMQAKAIFDELLGPEHPKSQQWHEDLFFLIHAPVIQSMVKEAQKTITPPEGFDKPAEDVASGDADMPQQWWMQNLFDMKTRTGDGDGDEDEDVSSQWWMQNLYSMGDNSKAPGQEGGEDEVSFMHVIFGTPRDGNNTARGGPAFTPRGTLAALAQASGKTGATVSLGMPMQKQSGIPEETATEDAVNMGFAKEWVQKVFETPRGKDGKDGEAEMNDRVAEATQWLQDSFGITPRGGAGTTTNRDEFGRTPRTAEMENAFVSMQQLFTPRGQQPKSLGGLTAQTDDAVIMNAMKATLSTPRAPTATASVDDTPMAGAVNKMFKKGSLQHV